MFTDQCLLINVDLLTYLLVKFLLILIHWSFADSVLPEI